MGERKKGDAYEHRTEVAGSGDRFADDPAMEHQPDAGPRNVRNEVDPEHLADAGTHGPETRRETRITEAEGLKRGRDREG